MKNLNWTASGACGILLLTQSALAQSEESKTSASIGVAADERSATSNADSSAEQSNAADESAAQTEPANEAEPAAESAAVDAQEPHEPYLQRFRPEANTWEVGLAAGILLPSPALELVRGPRDTPTSYKGAAVEALGRLAYFPTSYLGVEGEFMVGEGGTGNGVAVFNAYRGHLIAQLPFWSITPFILAGAGGMAATSKDFGHDIDFAVHFGGGLKIPFSKVFALRADFRENMTRRSNSDFSGISFNEEVTLGAVWTFGRKKPQPAPAPVPEPDRDGDHMPDLYDSCPDLAALTDNGCPVDSDEDGVYDLEDDCRLVPGKLENGCPEPDEDGDGIDAPCDLCPKVSGVAPDGCPIEDKDKDGILDDVDQCVDEPETANGFEDDDGCPDEVPKEVEKFTGTIKGIQFVQGSAKIRDSSEGQLNAAKDVLQKYPSVKLEVSGHTSSEGEKDFNQKLSEDRAQAVVDWLVAGGVPEDRLVARGAGSDEPVADNKTRQGREKNRRIEFRLLTQ